MAYKPNIPQAGDLISESQSDILENFQALNDSRITEHNLDISDPSNGYYVEYENGLLVCWINDLVLGYEGFSNRLEVDWTYPNSFNDKPHISISFSPDESIGSIADNNNYSVEDLNQVLFYCDSVSANQVTARAENIIYNNFQDGDEIPGIYLKAVGIRG